MYTPQERRKAHKIETAKRLVVAALPVIGIIYIVLALGLAGRMDYEDQKAQAGTGETYSRQTVYEVCDRSNGIINGAWEEVCGDLQDLSRIEYR